jgi:hypothetical protein
MCENKVSLGWIGHSMHYSLKGLARDWNIETLLLGMEKSHAIVIE